MSPPFDIDRFVVERDRVSTCEQAISEQIDALEDGQATRPAFMIIGAPRAGTTFLFALLNSVPDVYIPVAKELKFFSANLIACDLESYLGNFKPAAGRICGEGTPSYANLPPSRIELIRRLNPDLKIVYLLREPRHRLASEWKHCSRGLSNPTEPDLVAYVASDGPVGACDYAGNLERWLRFFPASQIKVCFYDDLSRDPGRVLDEILDFLGARPHTVRKKELLQRHNETWHDPDVQEAVDRIVPYLLGAKTARLVPLMQRAFPGTALPQWVRSPDLATDPPLMRLMEVVPGASAAVTVHGDYLFGATSALEELARASDIDYRRMRDLGLGIGRYLAEAIGHHLVIEHLGEKRLYALSHGDQWDGDLFLVRENCFGWNIVFYRRRFFAVRVGVGQVDLRSIDARRLRDLVDRGDVREFARLEDAVEYAASLWTHLSLIDA